MVRMLFVAALTVALGVARPAQAQRPSSGRDDVKKLEAELARLKEQVKETEARLEKAKADDRKDGDRRDDRGGPRGRFGRGPMPFGGPGRGFPGRGPGGFGPPGRGGREGPGRPDADKSNVDKRLDRIEKELEQLRKDLGKK